MKYSPQFPPLRWTRLALAATMVMVALPVSAADFTWVSPHGSATVFAEGPLRSSITAASTGAIGGSEEVFLPYLEADSLPAAARAEVIDGGNSFVSISRLAVEEAQAEGLYLSGGTSFSGTGLGGSGEARITLRLLIELPTAASIDLFHVRSAVPEGTGAEAFSLSLYRSDDAGGAFGEALLSFSGGSFDAAGTWQADGPGFYVLELDSFVAASSAGAMEGSQFSFFVGFGEFTPVPEPGTATLLAGGLALFGAVAFSRRCGKLKAAFGLAGMRGQQCPLGH